jgi:hypothetical protein
LSETEFGSIFQVDLAWGEGTVQHYERDQVTVLFDQHGYRQPHVDVVLERGLLWQQ